MYGIVASNEIFHDSNSIKDLIMKNKMLTMQHRKNKRGLQQLSDAQKMEAITKVQKGETKAAVAREFGVPESTLRGWCKKAKLNGHCHTVLNKSLQVTSTMSPVLLNPEMAYRDCSYSKGSGSDEGSATHPFSDEQEDEDVKPSVVIPEEQRRVLDWLNYGHYPQLAAAAAAVAAAAAASQTPPPNDNKPAQPVVTSSTCDDSVKSAPKMVKPHKKHNKAQNVNTKNVGFYNWCKSNKTCNSPVSPISPASSDKNDSYEDEPLALIVPSKRRFSDLEASLKNELNRMYRDDHTIINLSNHNFNNNDSCSKNNNIFSNAHQSLNYSLNNDHNICNSINYNNNSNNNNNNNSIINNNTITTTTNNNNNNTNNNDIKQTLSVEEALKHGEVFLDWLKACSDPNVTVFQAMQIGTLIKNLRSSLERNQNRR